MSDEANTNQNEDAVDTSMSFEVETNNPLAGLDDSQVADAVMAKLTEQRAGTPDPESAPLHDPSVDFAKAAMKAIEDLNDDPEALDAVITQNPDLFPTGSVDSAADAERAVRTAHRLLEEQALAAAATERADQVEADTFIDQFAGAVGPDEVEQVLDAAMARFGSIDSPGMTALLEHIKETASEYEDEYGTVHNDLATTYEWLVQEEEQRREAAAEYNAVQAQARAEREQIESQMAADEYADRVKNMLGKYGDSERLLGTATQFARLFGIAEAQSPAEATYLAETGLRAAREQEISTAKQDLANSILQAATAREPSYRDEFGDQFLPPHEQEAGNQMRAEKIAVPASRKERLDAFSAAFDAKTQKNAEFRQEADAAAMRAEKRAEEQKAELRGSGRTVRVKRA